MPDLPDELRHAYRALLRAASYLPDSAARAYIHKYAVCRYRDVANKMQSSRGQTQEELVARYHSRERIRKVWQASRQLERAGQGSFADLHKVLFLTYGRSGKRRRELVQEVLEPDEDGFPADQAALEELIQKQSVGEGPKSKESLKLKALIHSQRSHQPVETRGVKPKNVSATIPEKNIWGRPLPLKLQASIKQRYWVDTLEKLLPPVPEHEWDRLRDLATGRIPLEDAIPQRSRPLPKPPSSPILEYFTTPTNWHKSKMNAIKVGDDYIATALETSNHIARVTTLTPRSMRRLYATIWNMTPKMTQDEDTKKWTTKWGGARSAAHAGNISAPSAVDIELFEGADEEVKPDQSSSSQGRRKKRRRAKKEPRSEPKVHFVDDGYSQGIVPTI